MRSIDCHIHLTPPKMMRPSVYSSLFSTKGFNPSEYNEFVKNPDRLLHEMDLGDIERVGLISYQAKRVIGTGNDYISFIARYRKRSKDRLIQVGSVDPSNDENPLKTLEWQYSSLDVTILKLHPVHQLFKPNAYRKEEGRRLPKLERIYEFAQDHGMSIMFHTGTSILQGAEIKYGDPIFLDNVANDFPKLRIIMCHAGRPIWMPTAQVLLCKHENMLVDLSGIPPRKLFDYLPKIGSLKDRAIFGSDWASPGVRGIRQSKAQFEKVKLSQEAKKMILFANADPIFRA